MREKRLQASEQKSDIMITSRIICQLYTKVRCSENKNLETAAGMLK